MKEDISIYCPYCNRFTSIRYATQKICFADGTEEIYKSNTIDRSGSTWSICFCNYCQSVLLLNERTGSIYPNPRPVPSDSRIPDDLRIDLDEAKLCLSIDCHRACCVMCRRAIQTACMNKGGEGRDLFSQIDDLAHKRVITKDLADFAHTVRALGRDAAHPDFGPVEKEDAEDCLALTVQFLNTLFVTPTIAAERLKKRSGKL